jgi:hypothetical protein
MALVLKFGKTVPRRRSLVVAPAATRELLGRLVDDLQVIALVDPVMIKVMAPVIRKLAEPLRNAV